MCITLMESTGRMFIIEGVQSGFHFEYNLSMPNDCDLWEHFNGARLTVYSKYDSREHTCQDSISILRIYDRKASL